MIIRRFFGPQEYRTAESARTLAPPQSRLTTALLLSLLVHALLLSLQFGIRGFGLPGMQLPWGERRAYAPTLNVRIAGANRTPSPPPSSAAATVQSPKPETPRQRTSAASPTVVTPRMKLLPHARKAPVDLRRREERKRPPVSVKQPRKAAAARRHRHKKPAPPAPHPRLIAREQVKDLFTVPMASAVEADTASMREPPSAAPEPITAREEEQLRKERDIAAQKLEEENARREALELEKQRQAEQIAQQQAAQRLEEENLQRTRELEARRMEEVNAMQQAEELAARKQADQLAQQQAARQLEEENLQRIRELETQKEAQRIAQQLEEEKRRAQELETRRMEEENARRQAAKLDAQREAERIAQQQAALQLEEEKRRAQELEARRMEEENARRLAEELEARRQAEQIAQQQAARQLEEQRTRQMEATKLAEENAQREPAELDSRQQGQQAAMQPVQIQAGDVTANGGAQAQEFAQNAGLAPTKIPGETPRSNPAPLTSGSADTKSLRGNTPSDTDDGPILLSDSDLAGAKVEQLRKVDATRLNMSVEDSRRRSIFGGADDDIVLKMYIDSWRRAVERAAVPEHTQVPISGDADVTVVIRSDGSIDNIIVNRSDERHALDEMVRRIAASSGQQDPFPPDLVRRYDVIEIRRIWRFGDRLLILDAEH